MQNTVLTALLYLFFSQKSISFTYNKNFYNGKTMPNLVISPRAIQVVNKSINLFHNHGFHTVGVDRIVKESQIPKATFYHYFHSKERFIEICMIVQKERLKEKVVSMVEYTSQTSVVDKLKKLYVLHTDLEGL